MRARAAIRAEAAGAGTRLVELRSDPPLTVRATPDGSRPAVACVHLVGSSAAPVGGDDLGLRVSVGPGAALDVGAVAAALAQPDPRGRRSHLAVEVDVGAGGRLWWRGQPTVAVRGCDHRTTTTVRLAAGAAVLWREELVVGRHGEEPGSVAQRLAVDLDGDGPLLRTQLALGPVWPGSLGPGGAGVGTRAVGSVLAAGAEANEVAERWAALAGTDAAGGEGPVRAAVLPLDGPGVVLQAVARSAGALATFLDRAWDAAAALGPPAAVDPPGPAGQPGQPGTGGPVGQPDRVGAVAPAGAGATGGDLAAAG